MVMMMIMVTMMMMMMMITMITILIDDDDDYKYATADSAYDDDDTESTDESLQMVVDDSPHSRGHDSPQGELLLLGHFLASASCCLMGARICDNCCFGFVSKFFLLFLRICFML